MFSLQINKIYSLVADYARKETVSVGMLARAHDMRYQAEVRWMNIWWIHNDVDVSGHDRNISETGINFKKIKVLFLFSAKQGVRAISEWVRVMIMSTCGLVLVNESESW